jgi:ribose transport system ATP-binding protein
MLGKQVEQMLERAETKTAPIAEDARPRLEARRLGSGQRLKDVSFALRPGEVLGLVALEGQGQDELFGMLAGSERPATGDMLVDGSPVSFRAPADAIQAGIVFVPADRAEALLMQRSVRENIALPFSRRISKWGRIRTKQEKPKVDGAIETLQIDTRAQGEARLLSGGNQQKVTIARWVADGVETMLCFDPTRGIDIGTKQQIYLLLRELADEGASILLYTSELSEVQLVCDRAIVIFGGEVVTEVDAADADESTLLRAAHNLSSGSSETASDASADEAGDS